MRKKTSIWVSGSQISVILAQFGSGSQITVILAQFETLDPKFQLFWLNLGLISLKLMATRKKLTHTKKYIYIILRLKYCNEKIN